MELTKKPEISLIHLRNSEESIMRGSLEQSESPVSKPRIFTDFPTEETSNLRSLNSPNTMSSVRETFFDRLKDVIVNNRLSETFKHIRTVSESKEEPQVDTDNQMTEAVEPHELMISNDVPTLMWCAYCKGERMTDVSYVNSSRTLWAAIGIFLAGGVAGCCLAPYCMNKCKRPQLTCSRCGHTVFMEGVE